MTSNTAPAVTIEALVEMFRKDEMVDDTINLCLLADPGDPSYVLEDQQLDRLIVTAAAFIEARIRYAVASPNPPWEAVVASVTLSFA